MDNNDLLILAFIAISLLTGIFMGAAFARDDAVRLGRFRFAGKNYKVLEGE